MNDQLTLIQNFGCGSVESSSAARTRFASLAPSRNGLGETNARERAAGWSIETSHDTWPQRAP